MVIGALEEQRNGKWRYFGFGKGISVLTRVSDHYATFGTKVIQAGAREGLFALDEIFALRQRDSQLDTAEHTTDTAGFTDLLFGAYDLVGLVFSPRIRNLADQRLWHLDDTALPALVEPQVANRINPERVVSPWDDLLRVGASFHEGAVLPSLLLTSSRCTPPRPRRPRWTGWLISLSGGRPATRRS